MANDIRGWMRISFPDICLTVEEKVKVSLFEAMKAHGGCGERVLIFTATAIG